MRLVAIACACLLAGCTARPENLSIVAHGLSKHAVQGRKSGKPYNEINGGAGLRARLNENWAVQVGSYRNSFHKVSAYGLADWSPLRWKHADSCLRITGGAFVGVSTGYPYEKTGGVVPAVGLQGAIRCGRVFVRVRAAPALRAKVVGTVEVGVTIAEF